MVALIDPSDLATQLTAAFIIFVASLIWIWIASDEGRRLIKYFFETPWLIGPLSALAAFFAALLLTDSDAPSPSIAPGAVVAFVEECEQHDGWAAYYPASGRMIVGAGPHHAPDDDNPRSNVSAAINEVPQQNLAIYDGPDELPDEQLREPTSANAGGKNRVGGAERHTLTELEMPSHSHNLKYRKTDGPTAGDYALGQDGGNNKIGFPTVDISTFETGKDQPHNNMPPYIALYFCKKEG